MKIPKNRSEIIHKLHQFEYPFISDADELMKQRKYREHAQKALRNTRIQTVLLFFLIITSLFLTIYFFIRYIDSNQLVFVWLGIVSWAVVVISIAYYSRIISYKKKRMEKIIKLIDGKNS